jgi:hypothetical protein
MFHLVLHHSPDCCTGPCGLCGQPVTLSQGLQLFLVDKRRPVCACCGRKAAPALAALLGLACAAERIAKIGQHTVSPPLSALLELARAAEHYTGSPSSPPGQLASR